MQPLNEMRAGIVGGMLASLLSVMTLTEFSRTILLAATGAAVSFGVSWLLKRLTKKVD